MKESVALAKEADAKKDFSSARSDNNIHRVRNEPERQLGSLRSVIGNIRHDGGTPSLDSIATELSSMHTAQRASVLLALQRTHGNRYVQRVVAGIQAKLKVGQPGDVYEQEADRVAEEVMRMPEPQVQRQIEPEEEEEETLQAKPLADQITPLVQRQVEEEEEDEEEKKKEEEEEILQTKEVPGQTPEVTPDLESRINALKDVGQPLPKPERSFMERRFGVDFSRVRVHTDSNAAQMSKELNAEAFTYGRDIYLGADKYSLGTYAGKRLLAHELTHVVQQKYATKVLNKYQPEKNFAGGRIFNFSDKVMKKNGTPTPPSGPKITHETKFTAPDGSDKTRKDIGVGEEVTFKGSAEGKWTATSGIPKTLAKGDTFTWTAPNRKRRSVTIKLKVGGEVASVKMKVIEPDKITATKLSEIVIAAGTAGAGMKLRFNYHPKEVSFGNVEAKEVSGPATGITGYYKKHYSKADLWHDSGDTFTAIKENNEDSAVDTVSTEDPDKPYEKGTFKWVIPNKFKVKTEGGDGKRFTKKVTQAFLMDKKGKVKITKAGASVERSP